jgi:hypothetical protein
LLPLRRPSSPDTLGGRYNRLDLGLLVSGEERVAQDGDSETVLGRQREALELNMAYRLTEDPLPKRNRQRIPPPLGAPVAAARHNPFRTTEPRTHLPLYAR